MVSSSPDASGRGFTLIEVLVALALLGMISALAVARLPVPRSDDTSAAHVARARRTAIHTGVADTVIVPDSVVLVLRPDGSASAARWCDSLACWSLDPWTGGVSRD